MGFDFHDSVHKFRLGGINATLCPTWQRRLKTQRVTTLHDG